MEEPLLKVENLKTQFVTWNGLVRALDGVSFEIQPGEVLGLVGETGCGKSVTALSIMNLIPENQGTVTEGEILFKGKSLADKQKAAVKISKGKRRLKLKVNRRKLKLNFREMNKIRGNTMAMIFQEPMTTLNPIMTIGRQIEDSLYSHQINHLAERIVARKEITEEQLKDIIVNTIDKKQKDYLDQFIEENPELSAIREQIGYIVNRTDVNSYRKKIMISYLCDSDRGVSRQLNRFLIGEFNRPSRFIPRIIREEARRLIIELLTMVNITEPAKVVNQYPHELSGGMRQRIVIAIAISSNPNLLIADEPTTALDVTIQAQILDILRGLNRDWKTSILFITHDLGVILEISNRVAVMYSGSIVETAKTTDIFRLPKHPYTQGLWSSIPNSDRRSGRLKSISGTVPDLINPPEGCKFNPRCSFALDICKNKVPEMVDLGEDHYVACWLYSKEMS